MRTEIQKTLGNDSSIIMSKLHKGKEPIILNKDQY